MSKAIQTAIGKILFIDDGDISGSHGVERVIHTAIKHPGNPLVTADSPSDGDNVIMGGTVRKEGPLYRMWYQGLQSHSSHSRLALYAESTDGIQWSKPNLGLHKDNAGKYGNNLYLDIERQDHNHSVMYTPHMGDGKAYTLLSYGPERPDKSAPDGYYIAFSEDGLRWTDGAEYPVIPGHQDVGWFTYDEYSQLFRGVVKTFLIIGNAKRRSVMCTQSRDGFHWDLPYPVTLPDTEDDEWTKGREGHNTQFYGMPIFRYESMLLGFLQVFKCTGRLVRGGAPMDGTTDVQLVCSRDGRSWERVGDRTPIIERGSKGDWDWGIVQTGHSLVPDTNEVRIYYFGSSYRHGKSEKGCKKIGMASWPTDRFVGLRAGSSEGEIHIPITTPGTKLHINANACGGSVTATISDTEGGLPNGVETSPSIPLTEDSLDHVFRWPQDNSMSKLPASLTTNVTLKICNAEIYSLWMD